MCIRDRREALTPLLSRSDVEFQQEGVAITAPAKLDALLQTAADWNEKYATLEALARAAWAEDIVALEAAVHEARTSLTVSYTHLDVYKRQQYCCNSLSILPTWKPSQTA